MDSNGPAPASTLGRPVLLAVAAAGVLLLMSLAPTIAASGPVRPAQPTGCAVGALCPSESATDTSTASASASEAPSASTGCFDVNGAPTACPTESAPATGSTPPTGSAEASSSVGVTPPATTTGTPPGGSGSTLALALVALSLGTGGLVLFGTRTGARRRR